MKQAVIEEYVPPIDLHRISRPRLSDESEIALFGSLRRNKYGLITLGEPDIVEAVIDSASANRYNRLEMNRHIMACDMYLRHRYMELSTINPKPPTPPVAIRPGKVKVTRWPRGTVSLQNIQGNEVELCVDG